MSNDQVTLFQNHGNIKEYNLPKQLWPLMGNLHRKRGWSDDDVDYWTEKLNEFCKVPDKWQKIFLDPEDTIKMSLIKGDFSAQTAMKLAELATKAESSMRTEEDIELFHKWLRENSKKASWDIRNLIKFEREYLAKFRDDIENLWLLGDWREHIDSIKDLSGHLLLIDPPYGMEYNSDRRKDRRIPRKHDKIKHDDFDGALNEIAASTRAMFNKLNEDAHVLCFCHWKNEHIVREIIESSGFKTRGSLVWYKNNIGMGDPYTTFAPQEERLVHAVKGSPVLFKRISNVLRAKKMDTSNHPTEKPVNLLETLIKVTTVEGELVIDNFGGVASTHVAAKILNRKYWGTEKIEKYFITGEERLITCDGQKVLWR